MATVSRAGAATRMQEMAEVCHAYGSVAVAQASADVLHTVHMWASDHFGQLRLLGLTTPAFLVTGVPLDQAGSIADALPRVKYVHMCCFRTRARVVAMLVEQHC